MSAPARARVTATPGFARRLAEARQFMAQQDAESAPRRWARLQAQVQAVRGRLASYPAMGRPARAMESTSVHTQAMRDALSALLASLGLHGLREVVIGRYVLLYAHDDARVVLLSLRHERQLSFRLS